MRERTPANAATRSQRRIKRFEGMLPEGGDSSDSNGDLPRHECGSSASDLRTHRLREHAGGYGTEDAVWEAPGLPVPRQSPRVQGTV